MRPTGRDFYTNFFPIVESVDTQYGNSVLTSKKYIIPKIILFLNGIGIRADGLHSRQFKYLNS